MPQRQVTPTNKWWKWQNLYGSQVRQTLYRNALRTLLDDGFDRLKVALHPIVVYHKESSKLAEKLFCCISDDVEHDTEFGFEMQRELVKILKKCRP